MSQGGGMFGHRQYDSHYGDRSHLYRDNDIKEGL